MILDHCGKPGIKQGAIDQYRDDVADLATRPEHVDQAVRPAAVGRSDNWTEADLRPYIEATLDAFGTERTIYAGDYPILLQATTMTEWVEVLDRAFADLGLCESRDPRDLPRQRHPLLPAGPLGAWRQADDGRSRRIRTTRSPNWSRRRRPQPKPDFGGPNCSSAARSPSRSRTASSAMIKSGNLRPGDRLPTEAQMAVAFGISRPPLREALKALT